jgi:hypothetical protein
MAGNTYPLMTTSAGARVTMTGARGVDPDAIAVQLRDIAKRIGKVFAGAAAPLPLKSVELALTIGGEGKVGFLGSGVAAKAEGSITLAFERPEPKAP